MKLSLRLLQDNYTKNLFLYSLICLLSFPAYSFAGEFSIFFDGVFPKRRSEHHERNAILRPNGHCRYNVNSARCECAGLNAHITFEDKKHKSIEEEYSFRPSAGEALNHPYFNGKDEEHAGNTGGVRGDHSVETQAGSVPGTNRWLFSEFDGARTSYSDSSPTLTGECANLKGAFTDGIRGASINMANFPLERTRRQNFKGADFSGADLSVVIFPSDPKILRELLLGAKFDDNTKFPTAWGSTRKEQLAYALSTGMLGDIGEKPSDGFFSSCKLQRELKRFEENVFGQIYVHHEEVSVPVGSGCTEEQKFVAKEGATFDGTRWIVKEIHKKAAAEDAPFASRDVH